MAVETIRFDTIQEELRFLAEAHGMIPTADNRAEGEEKSDKDNFLNDEILPSKRWKHKLERRHVALEFSPRLDADGPQTWTQKLFYAFARVVCQSGRIPRKELFETWAVALYIHQAFPRARRIADLASGHGLLSWALLILSHHHHNSSTDDPNQKLSVVCVDRIRPKAVDLIKDSMVEEWPDLDEYWDFVQGPVEAVKSDSSTVLVGIHACATLTDLILELAIGGPGMSPLALVPCCHSKASLADEQKDDYTRREAANKELSIADSALPLHGDTPVGFFNLADFIDQQRTLRLEHCGYYVQEARIPKVFTPKNRIIVAQPLNDEAISNSKLSSSVPEAYEIKPDTKPNPRQRAPKVVSIPVSNGLAARNIVRRLGDSREHIYNRSRVTLEDIRNERQKV